jgi:hypothetical protein
MPGTGFCTVTTALLPIPPSILTGGVDPRSDGSTCRRLVKPNERSLDNPESSGRNRPPPPQTPTPPRCSGIQALPARLDFTRCGSPALSRYSRTHAAWWLMGASLQQMPPCAGHHVARAGDEPCRRRSVDARATTATFADPGKSRGRSTGQTQPAYSRHISTPAPGSLAALHEEAIASDHVEILWMPDLRNGRPMDRIHLHRQVNQIRRVSQGAAATTRMTFVEIPGPPRSPWKSMRRVPRLLTNTSQPTVRSPQPSCVAVIDD